MPRIKPEASEAQYYAGSPEQAFHLSGTRLRKPGFTKKTKMATRLNFKTNKYYHGLH